MSDPRLGKRLDDAPAKSGSKLGRKLDDAPAKTEDGPSFLDKAGEAAGDFLTSATEAGTLGKDDEIAGGVEAIKAIFSDETMAEAFKRGQAARQKKKALAKARSPIAWGVGKASPMGAAEAIADDPQETAADTLSAGATGLAFEFDDEAVGAGRGAVSALTGGDFSEEYERGRDDYRQYKERRDERSPIASTVGKAAGMAAPALATGGGAAALRGGVAAARGGMARVAGAGVAEGALEAGGRSEAETLGGVGEDMAQGAGTGLLASTAVAGAMRGGNALVRGARKALSGGADKARLRQVGIDPDDMAQDEITKQAEIQRGLGIGRGIETSGQSKQRAREAAGHLEQVQREVLEGVAPEGATLIAPSRVDIDLNAAVDALPASAGRERSFLGRLSKSLRQKYGEGMSLQDAIAESDYLARQPGDAAAQAKRILDDHIAQASGPKQAQLAGISEAKQGVNRALAAPAAQPEGLAQHPQFAAREGAKRMGRAFGAAGIGAAAGGLMSPVMAVPGAAAAVVANRALQGRESGLMAEAMERTGRVVDRYISPVTKALDTSSDVAGSLAARGAGALVAEDAERGAEKMRQVAQQNPDQLAEEHYLESLNNPAYRRAIMEEDENGPPGP